MAPTVKETKEILQFVIALANYIAANAGKTPLGLVLTVGDLLTVLQLLPAAVKGSRLAVREILAGLNEEDKSELVAVIQQFKCPSSTVEQVVEGALNATVALADLIAVLRKEAQP